MQPSMQGEQTLLSQYHGRCIQRKRLAGLAPEPLSVLLLPQSAAVRGPSKVPVSLYVLGPKQVSLGRLSGVVGGEDCGALQAARPQC